MQPSTEFSIVLQNESPDESSMLMNHVKDQINGEVRTSRRLQSKRNYPKSGSDVQVRPMPEDGFDFTDWDLSDDSTIPMDEFVLTGI